jgi:hypothetical protein
MKCRDCGESHQLPVRCKDRFCVICSGYRLSIHRDAMKRAIREQRKLTKLPMWHLTFTIQNMSDLKEGLEDLQKAWKRMRYRTVWKNKVEGGFRVLEVTLGRDGKWHPHLHVVMFSKFWPEKQLKKIWREARGVAEGERAWGVKISRCDEKAVYYVTKYLTKCDFPEKYKGYVNGCLEGKRLYMTFGTIRVLALGMVKATRACPFCGSINYGCVQRFFFVDMPDLRGLSPPLDREIFKQLDDRAFAALNKTMTMVHASKIKRKLKNMAVDRRLGVQYQQSCTMAG